MASYNQNRTYNSVIALNQHPTNTLDRNRGIERVYRKRGVEREGRAELGMRKNATAGTIP